MNKFFQFNEFVELGDYYGAIKDFNLAKELKD